ncbi:T9SS type A sorting domain-containing protein [bacterium]|nr:T9SS type A sorting domain-containing protein [bacterium]
MKTLLLTFISIFWLSQMTLAQFIAGPNGQYKDSLEICQGEEVEFKTLVLYGGDQITWDYGFGEVEVPDTTIVFDTAGTFTLDFTRISSVKNEQKSLYLMVKESPVPNVKLISEDSQCIHNNYFCFQDSTGSSLSQSSLAFTRFEIEDDTFTSYYGAPASFYWCIESQVLGENKRIITYYETSEGCGIHDTLSTTINVSGSDPEFTINNSFLNRCDSFKVSLTHISEPRQRIEDVEYFRWDFGDGTTIIGDSNTNTEYWYGFNNDQIIEHVYQEEGTFEISLTYKVAGCETTFTHPDYITVVDPKLEIIAEQDYLNVFNFKLKNGPPVGASSWLWNFGDPYSGPSNMNSEAFEVSHTYSKNGPHRVSFRVIAGPCDKTVYDTIFATGPIAKIETSTDKIPDDLKYQCGDKDTIHFINNSTFFWNDDTPYDEDSFINVNGEWIVQFDANGNPLTTERHLANRTKGDDFYYFWIFDDPLAPACTTDTKNGINIDSNCAYSLDKFPKHVFPTKEEFYQWTYNQNISYNIGRVRYIDSLCYSELIDTTKPQLHRRVFEEKYYNSFRTLLQIYDSNDKVVSHDYVDISTSLEGDPGLYIPPVYDRCVSQYANPFRFAKTPYWFALNTDSISQEFKPEDSVKFTPILVPYPNNDQYRYSFAFKYDSAAIQAHYDAGGSGEITIGIIVGRGPINQDGFRSCLDTFWYHHILELCDPNDTFAYAQPEDASFEILNPEDYGLGDAIAVKLNHPSRSAVSNFTLSLQNIRPTSHYKSYQEDYYSLQNYEGPSPSRNDSNIMYNGENWRFNYVVRRYEDNITRDTVVTAIIKNFKTARTINTPRKWSGPYPNSLTSPKINYDSIEYILGVCLDTSGPHTPIIYTDTEYEFDSLSFFVGNSIYRYTDPSKTDSIEIIQYLSPLDSLILGPDTFFGTSDTIPNVFLFETTINQYDYNCDNSVDTSDYQLKGLAFIRSRMSNDFTFKQHHDTLISGFMYDLFLSRKIECLGKEVSIGGSINYISQDNDMFGPLNLVDSLYWEDLDRIQSGKEVFDVDWDKSDGLNDFQSYPDVQHAYTTPGHHTITVHLRDSTGRHEYVELEVYIPEFEAAFDIEPSDISCDNQLSFTNNAQLVKPCLAPNSCNSDSVCESIFRTFYFKVENGQFSTIDLDNPLPNGDYQLAQIIETSSGCKDTAFQNISTSSLRAEFSFHAPTSIFGDTTFLEATDSIILLNKSKANAGDSIWVMWGDGTISKYHAKTAYFRHQYDSVGLFPISMILVRDKGDYKCIKSYPEGGSKLASVNKTGIVKVLKQPEISIYPNPADNRINISSDQYIHKIEILDLNAKSVNVEANRASSSVYQVDLNLPPGLYFVKLYLETGISVRKLIIE